MRILESFRKDKPKTDSQSEVKPDSVSRPEVRVIVPKSNREQRRRLNKILEICKSRFDKKAQECFDSDCEQIKEVNQFSTNVRKRGDGSKQTKSIDTGNIIISCEVHGWKGLFSVSQLDNLPMPARTTSVNEGAPINTNPDGTIVER